MSDRSKKSLHRLAAERAPGAIGDRSGNQQRHSSAELFKKFCDCKKSGLGVERVEDSFDREQIDAAMQKRFGLVVIRFL